MTDSTSGDRHRRRWVGTLEVVRRLDSLLLAGVGIMAIHQIAYALATFGGSTSTVGHGHLETAWTLGSLAAIAGLASAVTQSLKRRHHTTLPLAALAFTLGSGYTALELAERSLNGLDPVSLFGEAVFWIGLAAALPVAFALRASVRTVADLVLQLTDRVDERPFTYHVSGPARFSQTRRVPIPLPVRSRPCSRRGPPFVR